MLTEEELVECWGTPDSLDTETLRTFARRIEALVKAKQEPLREEEIDVYFAGPEASPEYEHGFRDGIWFAEKHHGIGGGDE